MEGNSNLPYSSGIPQGQRRIQGTTVHGVKEGQIRLDAIFTKDNEIIFYIWAIDKEKIRQIGSLEKIILEGVLCVLGKY